MSTYGVGRWGERIAVRYLETKGYRILATNYRWQRAEIDIVALDGNLVVFVEVKTRKGERFGSPEGAVDRRKQSQIARVAARFLQAHRLEERDCRFDVVALREWPEAGRVVVDHFENAFWVDRRFLL